MPATPQPAFAHLVHDESLAGRDSAPASPVKTNSRGFSPGERAQKGSLAGHPSRDRIEAADAGQILTQTIAASVPTLR